MRVIDTDYMIESMQDDTSFVFRCEELFHDKISHAAAKILSKRSAKPAVLLAGPSGSGKTTTAMRLRDYLENLDVPVCMLSMDNFFLPVSKRPPEAEDWESPHCVDWKRLSEAVRTLMEGKEAELPIYDFKVSDYGGSFTMQGNKDAVIIVEGIHMLNPLVMDQMKDIATGVYVAPRTRIVTPDEKLISPEEVRIARRMIRDYHGRGRSLRDTVLMAESVDAGEMKHISPYKGNASIHIDTFHDYEPCILAQYILELPELVNGPDAEFVQEHGLEKLIELAKTLPPLRTTYIPKDSIVREFVGGSKYVY